MQYLLDGMIKVEAYLNDLTGSEIELSVIGLWLVILAIALIIRMIEGRAGFLTSVCCFGIILLNILLVSHMITMGGYR